MLSEQYFKHHLLQLTLLIFRLKCKYLSENHPFLKLAPVKLEELYLGPDVYLFHNVISDREIEDINSVSKTRVSILIKQLVSWAKDDVYIIFKRVCSLSHALCSKREKVQNIGCGSVIPRF